MEKNKELIIPYNELNFERNYLLSNGNYFHLHTNDEGYYYDVYNSQGKEIDGGLLEYGDDEEKQTLEMVIERLVDFTGINELRFATEIDENQMFKTKIYDVFIDFERNYGVLTLVGTAEQLIKAVSTFYDYSEKVKFRVYPNDNGSKYTKDFEFAVDLIDYLQILKDGEE